MSGPSQKQGSRVTPRFSLSVQSSFTLALRGPSRVGSDQALAEVMASEACCISSGETSLI